VNTGYGGSADTRTSNHDNLQLALIQHTQSAVLTSFDKGGDSAAHLDASSYAMPTSWVRGAMLVRGNQTIRGHSAVRVEVVETLYKVIRKNLTPVVPLRGSISASGDLMPLLYITRAP
jgi:phenylalanine ammonia-lyase